MNRKSLSRFASALTLAFFVSACSHSPAPSTPQADERPVALVAGRAGGSMLDSIGTWATLRHGDAHSDPASYSFLILDSHYHDLLSFEPDTSPAGQALAAGKAVLFLNLEAEDNLPEGLIARLSGVTLGAAGDHVLLQPAADTDIGARYRVTLFAAGAASAAELGLETLEVGETEALTLDPLSLALQNEGLTVALQDTSPTQVLAERLQSYLAPEAGLETAANITLHYNNQCAQMPQAVACRFWPVTLERAFYDNSSGQTRFFVLNQYYYSFRSHEFGRTVNYLHLISRGMANPNNGRAIRNNGDYERGWYQTQFSYHVEPQAVGVQTSNGISWNYNLPTGLNWYASSPKTSNNGTQVTSSTSYTLGAEGNNNGGGGSASATVSSSESTTIEHWRVDEMTSGRRMGWRYAQSFPYDATGSSWSSAYNNWGHIKAMPYLSTSTMQYRTDAVWRSESVITGWRLFRVDISHRLENIRCTRRSPGVCWSLSRASTTVNSGYTIGIYLH